MVSLAESITKLLDQLDRISKKADKLYSMVNVSENLSSRDSNLQSSSRPSLAQTQIAKPSTSTLKNPSTNPSKESSPKPADKSALIDEILHAQQRKVDLTEEERKKELERQRSKHLTVKNQILQAAQAGSVKSSESGTVESSSEEETSETE